MTELSEELLAEIRELFEYRNRALHSQVEIFQTTFTDEDFLRIEELGRRDEYEKARDRGLRSGDWRALNRLRNELGTGPMHIGSFGAGPRDLDAARRNYDVARRAMDALYGELDAPGWPDVNFEEFDALDDT